MGTTSLQCEDAWDHAHALLLDHGAGAAAQSRLWHDLDSPLAGARTRVHPAAVCAALGDAEMKRTTAREVFETIGAKDDLAGLRGNRRARSPLNLGEFEVLRKVARA